MTTEGRDMSGSRTGAGGLFELAPPLPIIRARRNASRAPTASLRDGLRPPLTQPVGSYRCSATGNQPSVRRARKEPSGPN